jgi:hypothetical protein
MSILGDDDSLLGSTPSGSENNYAASLGRISGKALEANLLRNGIDLAVNGDLLYLKVSPVQAGTIGSPEFDDQDPNFGKTGSTSLPSTAIGINTDVPIYTLDVNSEANFNDLIVTTQAAIDNIIINAPDQFTTSVGAIQVRPPGINPIMFHDRLTTSALIFNDNSISSISNQNITFDPNGTGQFRIEADTNITGDLGVSGNITISGNLSKQGSIFLGDDRFDGEGNVPENDTITINTDFAQSIIPGQDLTYNLGIDKSDSTPRRWAQAHIPDWTKITTGAWAGSGLRPQAVIVSDQMRLDGVVNKISAIQSNEDILLNPDTGIVYVESVQFGEDLPLGLTQTLNNPNAYGTTADDFFGQEIAISGSRLIVGVSNEDDAGGSGSGKAYVYDLSTNTLLYTLNNPNAFGTSNFDFFGASVGLSSSYAIVGAVGETKIDENDPNYYLTGKAYIFNADTGALLHTLDNPNSGYVGENQFGGNVAITNTRAIVSSVGYPNISYSGRVYIYNPVTGALLYTLNNPNVFGTTTNDNFGSSVAISDLYAIVGAPGEDDTAGFPGASSGKAYIYNASTGAFLRTLSNPNADGYAFIDEFGRSVAISDSYAVVGVPNEDGAGFDSGIVYIFNPATGALLRTLSNPNAYSTISDDRFGSSVAISGSRVIVGATGEDDAGGTSSGKAYIFDISTGTLLHTLNNPNAYGTSAADSFGSSVAISDSYAVVGAGGEDDAGGTGSGKVYIFSDLPADQSVIKNLLNTPLTLGSTGIGYTQFSSTNAILIPTGDNSQRRATPEVGETRWNIEVGYLECFDGTVWNISTGGGDEVTQVIMEDLGHVYTLMLG